MKRIDFRVLLKSIGLFILVIGAIIGFCFFTTFYPVAGCCIFIICVSVVCIWCIYDIVLDSERRIKNHTKDPGSM